MVIISENGEEYFDVEYKKLHIHREKFNSMVLYENNIILHCGITEAEHTIENIRQCMCKGIPVVDLTAEYKSHAHNISVKEQFNNVSSIYSI